MNRKLGWINIFLICFITFLLPFKNSLCVDAVKSGVDICLNTLIPSLFPFLFFSSLLSQFCGGVLSSVFAPLLCPVFNISVPAASAFVLGTLGGFPTGASVAASLYKQKKISKDEAERLPVFCNNAGIMFVISAVGKEFFGSISIGLTLYAVHILSSVVAGIITRPKEKMYSFEKNFLKKSLSEFTPPSLTAVFPGCIFSSVKAMAAISANFIVFRAVTYILFSGFDTTGSAVLKGIFEMVGGIFSLGKTPKDLIAASFILGFNGLCIHMQTASVFFGSGLSPLKCITGKLICAFSSVAAMLAAFYFSKFEVSGFLTHAHVILLSLGLFCPGALFFLIRKRKTGHS